MTPRPFSPEQAYDVLEDSGDVFRGASRSLEEAQQLRDAAIIVSSEKGFSRRRVAAAAGVTVGRVQQVLMQTDRQAQSRLAKRLLQIGVARLPAKERSRYLDEWTAELAQARPVQRLSIALGLLRASGSLKKILSEESAGTAFSEDCRQEP